MIDEIRHALRRLRATPVVTLSAVACLAIGVWMQQKPTARALTQKDIDSAVLHTLATQTLPSRAAKAYEAVRPSVEVIRRK